MGTLQTFERVLLVVAFSVGAIVAFTGGGRGDDLGFLGYFLMFLPVAVFGGRQAQRRRSTQSSDPH